MPLYKLLRDSLRQAIIQTEIGYRFILKKNYRVDRPIGYPKVTWQNTALKTREQWEQALEQTQQLGLPPHPDLQKNWDSLVALNCILQSTDPSAHILDAGGETYSMILPWLFLYGYKRLEAINLSFATSFKQGPIVYKNGDITHTDYKDLTFECVTCMSVIEHGVDLAAFFKEMFRIIKHGGFLILSTDYFEPPVDTAGNGAYGFPTKIFSQPDVLSMLTLSQKAGFQLTGPVDLECDEKTVYWKKTNASYTFLNLVLYKKR